MGVDGNKKDFIWPKGESWYWVVAAQIESNTVMLVNYFHTMLVGGEWDWAENGNFFPNFPGTFSEIS